MCVSKGRHRQSRNWRGSGSARINRLKQPEKICKPIKRASVSWPHKCRHKNWQNHPKEKYKQREWLTACSKTFEKLMSKLKRWMLISKNSRFRMEQGRLKRQQHWRRNLERWACSSKLPKWRCLNRTESRISYKQKFKPSDSKAQPTYTKWKRRFPFSIWDFFASLKNKKFPASSGIS